MFGGILCVHISSVKLLKPQFSDDGLRGAVCCLHCYEGEKMVLLIRHQVSLSVTVKQGYESLLCSVDSSQHIMRSKPPSSNMVLWVMRANSSFCRCRKHIEINWDAFHVTLLLINSLKSQSNSLRYNLDIFPWTGTNLSMMFIVPRRCILWTLVILWLLTSYVNIFILYGNT